jgi:hypothetical protein
MHRAQQSRQNTFIAPRTVVKKIFWTPFLNAILGGKVPSLHPRTPLHAA